MPMMNKAEIERLAQQNMRLLKIPYEEAYQLVLDDLSDEMLPEQKELTEKAKQNLPRHYETSTKERKKAEKVRKVDTVKKGLLDLVLDALQDTVKITSILNELAADFEYSGDSYTIKITRHRPKKTK